MNLYDFLLSNASPEKPAVVSRQEQVTYAELIRTAESVAAALQQHGVLKGDRVGVLMENSAFWVASYLGIIKIGAVAVPMPQRLTADTFVSLTQLIQCDTFCVDPQRFARHRAVFPRGSRVLLPKQPPNVQADDPLTILTPIENGTAATADVAEAEDLAALMFTSGSTGQPNAVKVSHRNIMANTDSIVSYLNLAADDRMMVVLPFDYCFGTSLLHTHLRVGGTLVINNTFTFVETVLDDMEQFACTGIAGVPTVFQHLLRRSSLTRRQLPHLRHAQQAGGRLSEVFISEFSAAFPHARFFVMYGQTEATARLSFLPPERLHDKLGSIGKGIPGVQLEVLDESGNSVAPDQVGEIVARGDNITQGYWVPDPNKAPFRDGALHTGDLARVDSEGFIFIVGRNSEFLKLSGHRVSSKEIEDVLFELPDVLEAAVVGVQHPELGETARAYVVVAKGANVSSETVIKHCKRRLPPYAVPHDVQFLSELPKNASGKVLKNELRK